MTRTKRDKAEACLRRKVTYKKGYSESSILFFFKDTINAYTTNNYNYVLTKLLKVKFAPTIVKNH